jgi:hypothetical protein
MLPHPIVRVTKFKQVAPFTLYLEFDDDGAQTIDFFPVLHGRLFGPLRDPAFFAQVRIDPDCHTLVWPNDADFDPATLRYWPEYLPYMLESVEERKRAEASRAKSA